MAEDRKFKFDYRIGQFVNRVSGEAIPHDEPVILFRARDIHALSVLEFYYNLVLHPHHQQAVTERIEEFSSFRFNNPERMKEPGITRHIELHSSRRPENLQESRRHERSQDERLDRLENEEAALEGKMTKAMADIDILNSILQGIANDASTLTEDFKNLEAELQAAQDAAANNQPIDLTNAILLARGAQTALDGIVAAVPPAPTPAPTEEQPPVDEPVPGSPESIPSASAEAVAASAAEGELGAQVDEQPAEAQVDEQPVDEQPAEEQPSVDDTSGSSGGDGTSI